MTEPKRALTDLRPAAQDTLFAGWRVTPELKAKLHSRIERAEAPAPAGKVSRPWLRWGGATAVAAAAVVTLVMLGQSPELAPAKATAPATAPVPKEDEKAKATHGYGRGTPPPTVAQAPLKPGSVNFTISETMADTTVSPQTVLHATVQDQSGYAITVKDQNGSAITVTPVVPGVENQPGRKIILNAEYQLQVTDAVAAMQRLQNLAATTAGYVVDAGLNKGQDGSWSGRLTLRLPSGLYNGAIQEIRQIGEVRQERQWSQDVTERYYDLEARIRIQTEYERKLAELAAKASTFDDWMKLTRQINDTRALIEQMQGSIKLLSNQVEYSTINVSFTQPAPGKEPPPPPPEPDKGLWASMNRSFRHSVQWFADLGKALLVGAAAFAPFLVALALLGLAALVVWRRRPKRSS